MAVLAVLRRPAGWVAVAAALLVAVLLPAVSSEATTATSGNLLTGDAATFDHSTGGWVAFTPKVSLAAVTSPVQAGMRALQVSNGAGGPVDMWIGSGSGPSTWTPAVGNATYTATGFVHGGFAARIVQPAVIFYDASGAKLGASSGQQVTDAVDSWTPVRVVGLAPPTTAYVVTIVTFYGMSTGEAGYLDSVSLTSTTGSANPIAGPLHTAGNQILDANDRPVVLRGGQAEGAEYSAASLPTDQFVAGMARWRANFVRVPLAESLWLNTCPTGTASNDPAYPLAVDAAVKSITSRGMVAMLSLTFNTITACGPSGPNSMADASFSLPFWQQLASRYQSNNLVVFDLYNEPHDIPDSTWLLGGPVVQYPTYVAAGMQQMYSAIRAQGANNLVFVGGNNWASSPSSQPVSGTNVVNSVHAYTCPQHVPPGCPFDNPYDPSPILSRWLSVGTTSPVMITEFGWPNRSDGIYNQNVISYAEAQRWSWNAFAWLPTAAPWSLNDAASGTAFEPTPAGQPVLTGMANN